MSGRTQPASTTRVPPISTSILYLFRWLVRRSFRKDFHAVRASGLDRLTELDGPLLVYANHSGWWDPMIAFLLSEQLFPRRNHYAPMDAAALRRYQILAQIGVFPVELGSPRGAVHFLRTGEAILRDRGVLWVTPQGRFSDVRERPIAFKPGLSALAARVPGCIVLPMAIEYLFWDERTPEVLLRFGHPIRVQPGETASTLEPRLVTALETAMAELQTLALTRDPHQFERVLVRGRAGVGGFYALGKRLRALLTRQPYVPEHTAHPNPTTPHHA